MKKQNQKKGKVVFITGANGFLGSHLVKHALTRGSRVIAFIKDEMPGSIFWIEGLHRRTVVIKGDLVNRRCIDAVFKKYKIDLCLHIAAQAIVTIANKNPLSTFKSNIEGTWNILEAARIYGVGGLIVASSDKAYGEHRILPYREDAPLCANHPYDASKACADILARTYAHTYGLPVAVTRCANLYGPGDLNFSRIIPDTIRALLRNSSPVIRSDGKPLRDYLFIEDAVRGYFMLADNIKREEIRGEAFNFGCGRPIRVINLVSRIIKISRKTRLLPVILGKDKGRGEIQDQYLASSKARRALGWKPRYRLEEGLRKTYAWYEAFFKHRPL